MFAIALMILLSPQDDEIEKLKKKVKDLENEVEKIQEERQKEKEQGDPTPKSPNLLNPTITVFLNGAVRIDDETVIVGEDDSEIDDEIFLRGAEVDFRASVDPYVDAILIVAIEQEASREFAVEVEEGFGLIKGLPFLDEMPLGLRIKAGRYRAPLGISNLLHLHDLPWTTRPEPIVEYLGAEGGSFFEAGYGMDGGGLLFRLPSFENTSIDLEFHVARPGDIAITEGNDGQNPAFLGRLSFFAKPGETIDFTIGCSGYFELGSLSSNLFVIDAMFRWREIGEFRSLVIGGELFLVNRDFQVDVDDGMGGTIPMETDNSPMGYYLFAQYQISWHFYVGVRYDHVENIDNDSLDTDVYAAYVSYYTSEYFRVRLGIEHRKSDVLPEDEDAVNSVFLELNFVFGAHPPEPWWVNR